MKTYTILKIEYVMTRFLTIILLTAQFIVFLTAFAVAGEPLSRKVTIPQELAKKVDKYFDESDQQLEKLDNIMAREKMGENRWLSTAQKGYSAARELGGSISGYYRQKRMTRPRQLDDWIDEEIEAWSRVKRLGRRLAWDHDVLLHQIKTVTEAVNKVEEETKKYKKELAEFDDLIKRLADYDIMMRTGDPASAVLKFGLQKSKELYRDFTGVTPDIKAKVTFLFKESEKVKELRKEWNYKIYMDKAKEIIREKIDPDQKGVFRIHEAHWEEQLEALAKQYQSLFEKYDEASKWLRDIKEQPVFPAQRNLMLSFAVDYLENIAGELKKGIDSQD